MTTSCRQSFVNRPRMACFISREMWNGHISFLLKRDLVNSHEPWFLKWLPAKRELSPSLNSSSTVISYCVFHIFLMPTCDQAKTFKSQFVWVSFVLTIGFIHHDGNYLLTLSISFRLASRFSNTSAIFIWLGSLCYTLCGLITAPFNTCGIWNSNHHQQLRFCCRQST